MRRIKLSGRERAVLKALGFAEAIPGEQIREYTQIQPDDLTDVLNALLAAGLRREQTVSRASHVHRDADGGVRSKSRLRARTQKLDAARLGIAATRQRDSWRLCGWRGAILGAAFAEKLANDVFDRQFLHVDI